MLSGILTPTSGHACIAGLDVLQHARAVRARVGVLSEVPGLYLRSTAREYLDFFGDAYGLSKSLRQKRMIDLLQKFEMRDVIDRRLGEFSKGMKQKLALIRSMLHDPEVLLLDEPLGGLDPIVRDEVMRCVIGAAGERRRTILMATHDLEAAVRLADRVAVLHEGRIVREGPVEDFAPASAGSAPEALRRVLVLACEGR
jgi:ABC-2 type transport system ATP-binding protein